MIRLRYKILLVCFLLLAVALGLRHCGRPLPYTGSLKPGERQHITVKGHSVIITTQKGTTKQYVPDRVDISVSEVGMVRVKVAEFGFGLEPGAGLLFAGNTFKPFADTRLLYYYRASLHLGMDFNFNKDGVVAFGTQDAVLHPILLLNYSLPVLDGQLGAFVGYELFPSMSAAGLRWRF